MTDEEKRQPVTVQNYAGFLKMFLDLLVRTKALERLLQAIGVVSEEGLEAYVKQYYEDPRIREQYEALQQMAEPPAPDVFLELLKRFDGPVQ